MVSELENPISQIVASFRILERHLPQLMALIDAQTANISTDHRIGISDLLCAKQVSKILGVSLSLLEKWRRDAKGPAFIRLEGQRAIRYRLSDVMTFVDERRVRS
jgi:hypothetical protein